MAPKCFRVCVFVGIMDELTRVETASLAVPNCPSRSPEAEFAEVGKSQISRRLTATSSDGRHHFTLFHHPIDSVVAAIDKLSY